MAAAFDREKFLRVAAMLGSPHEGERHAAADLAYALLQKAGASWFDILNERSDDVSNDQLRVATEASEYLTALLAERDARIAELERGQPDWAPATRVTIGNHNAAARWLLERHGGGEVWLGQREQDFVAHAGRWVGPLPPKMRAWLQVILDRTAQRTGLVPP
jgi:hypothetical protein